MSTSGRLAAPAPALAEAPWGKATCIGAGLLASRPWRRAGRRIIAGTLVAAGLELALTLVLILAYSTANPGWDLS